MKPNQTDPENWKRARERMEWTEKYIPEENNVGAWIMLMIKNIWPRTHANLFARSRMDQI